MITKLGEHEYGIREEPAGYDDYDNDHDNDNESQQNASAQFLENMPRESCTLKQG